MNDTIPPKLSERYSIVLLDSCNENGIHIPQEVVDQLGVPVVYTTKIAGLCRTTSEDMVLAKPTESSR